MLIDLPIHLANLMREPTVVAEGTLQTLHVCLLCTSGSLIDEQMVRDLSRDMLQTWTEGIRVIVGIVRCLTIAVHHDGMGIDVSVDDVGGGVECLYCF